MPPLDERPRRAPAARARSRSNATAGTAASSSSERRILRRSRNREGAYQILMLSCNRERRPAGDQCREVRTGHKESGDVEPQPLKVLAVV